MEFLLSQFCYLLNQILFYTKGIDNSNLVQIHVAIVLDLLYELLLKSYILPLKILSIIC